MSYNLALFVIISYNHAQESSVINFVLLYKEDNRVVEKISYVCSLLTVFLLFFRYTLVNIFLCTLLNS